MSANQVGGCDHTNTQQFDDGWECLDCKAHFFTEDPIEEDDEEPTQHQLGCVCADCSGCDMTQWARNN